jgi:hypothetical protein
MNSSRFVLSNEQYGEQRETPQSVHRPLPPKPVKLVRFRSDAFFSSADRPRSNERRRVSGVRYRGFYRRLRVHLIFCENLSPMCPSVFVLDLHEVLFVTAYACFVIAILAAFGFKV